MRPIDADALMRSMKSALDSENPSMWSGASDAKTCFRFAMDFVCTAPTISPDEVRGVGEWTEDRMDYRCSVCGKSVKDEIFYMFEPYQMPPYCPNCGAMLRNGGTDDS